MTANMTEEIEAGVEVKPEMETQKAELKSNKNIIIKEADKQGIAVIMSTKQAQSPPPKIMCGGEVLFLKFGQREDP